MISLFINGQGEIHKRDCGEDGVIGYGRYITVSRGSKAPGTYPIISTHVYIYIYIYKSLERMLRDWLISGLVYHIGYFAVLHHLGS